MRRRAREFLESMASRRSIRQFSPRTVPRALIDLAIRAAAGAPSGANRQPWFFVVVGDRELKRKIRVAAEEEERKNYEGGRFPERWLKALEPLGTDWHKPYLETAPWLVVCFRQDYSLLPDGRRENHYYVVESVGIACGFFIAAIHQAGLVTLPHTPSPMRFLSSLLRRPRNEKPYVLFPVGYPAPGARIPDIQRKPFDQIVQEDDGTGRGDPEGDTDRNG
ncbi:MAG: nitroreductase family protein [Acidobacteriota bacterium]